MRILVTGGVGFIGSHVCEALLERGDDVLVIDNVNGFYDIDNKLGNLKLLNDKARLNTTRSFNFLLTDITDKAKVGEAFDRGVDAVIHLAGMAGVRASVDDPLLYERVNVQGTLNLLEECRKRGIGRFIAASSSSVYGRNSKPPFREDEPADRPSSPYAATKRSLELHCATYSELFGINCSCLRFFSVYGPRGRPDMAVWKFTEGILTKPPVVINGDGSIRRDLTYVGDVAQGVLAALDKAPRHEIFNLGRGQPTSMNELLAIVEKATGRKAEVEHRPAKDEDIPLTFADISKARAMLGYEPKVTLEEGVRRFVEWYTQR